MSNLSPLRATLDFLVDDRLGTSEHPATVDGLLDLAKAFATDPVLPHHFAQTGLPRIAAWLAPVDALGRLAADLPADGF